MSALVFAKLFECPPSMAYDASVNGAPAKPMSGTRPRSSDCIWRIAASTCPSASRDSKCFRRSMSAASLIGRSICGPSPLMKSNGSPIGSSGRSKSENRIAASTSMRRIGWSVTSVARSGWRQISSSECRARKARYSAMYRPACRMNQTGVASTGSRRQAFRKRESLTHGLSRQQFARQHDELVEPEGLVAQVGTEGANLVELSLSHVVIAGHDGDRRLREPGDGSNRPEELDAARQRHAEVQNDRMRPMQTCQMQAFVCRLGRPDLVALEAEHPREQVGYANIIIDDQHAGGGG